MILLTADVTVGQALLNTLMGIGTVFLVLWFISFIISLFDNFNKLTAPKKTEPQKEVPVIAAAEPEEEPEEELSDDEALVAVISAAVAAYQGTSAEGFQVRSIKRAGSRVR